MKSGYPSGLVASAFEMLIHYWWSPCDVPDALTADSDNYKALKQLEDNDLIFRDGDFHAPGSWRLTERGMALARHIVNLPLPVTAWTMPTSTVGDEHANR